MHGGYWPAFYPIAGRSAAVDVAVALDNIPLGTSPELGSVAPAPNVVVFISPESPSASLDAAVSIDPVPADATSTTTQPFVTLPNQDNARPESNLVAPLLFSLNSTVMESIFSLFVASSLPASSVAVSFESTAEIFLTAQPSSPELTRPM